MNSFVSLSIDMKGFIAGATKLLVRTEVRTPAASQSERSISRLTASLSDVSFGAVFVAIRGHAFDGHTVLQEAVARGAAALVVEDRAVFESMFNEGSTVATLIWAESSRQFLAECAHWANGFASRKIKVFGITGTNGKTTTTFLIEHILNELGCDSGLMGTVLHRLGTRIWSTKLTTPGPIEFHQRLAEMISAGAKAVALEVSSHAIDQSRVAGTEFDCTVWTSFSHDHLDYHKTVDHYFEAKMKLFTSELVRSSKGKRTAVLNTEVLSSAEAMGVSKTYIQRLRDWCKDISRRNDFQLLTYGPEGSTSFVDSDAVIHTTYRIELLNRTGMTVSMLSLNGKGQMKSQPLSFQLPLIGRYNAENAVAAILAASSAGFAIEQAAATLTRLRCIPGRLERVSNAPDQPMVFVDFAHTDDGLSNVLKALREYASQLQPKPNIFTVFGCGGDRDRSKRPKMGLAASELSDWVCLTSDNPRGEAPQKIIDEIFSGVPTARASRVAIETNRRAAIELALRSARTSDIVLIAGKGHETTQTIGDQVIEFNDVKVTLEVMEGLNQEKQA